MPQSLVRIARRIAGVLAEYHYAQRRMTALMTTPDTHMLAADKVPDTYAEFLFRASGSRLHEPNAARRARGQLVG